MSVREEDVTKEAKVRVTQLLEEDHAPRHAVSCPLDPQESMQSCQYLDFKPSETSFGFLTARIMINLCCFKATLVAEIECCRNKRLQMKVALGLEFGNGQGLGEF